jgi:hypothetical protein
MAEEEFQDEVFKEFCVIKGLLLELKDNQAKMQIQNTRRIQLLDEIRHDLRLQFAKVNKFLERQYRDEHDADWWKGESD